MNDLPMPPDDFLPWDDTPTEIGKVEEIRELADLRSKHHDLPSPEVTTPTTSPPPDVITAHLWKAMQLLHEQGLSLIWGRAEAQTIKGKVFGPKTPLVSTWSSEPERRLSLEALAKMMHNAPPGLKIAPIIICGKGSGNLWALDIDIKHWPGIDTRYLTALRETYPELYKKIRRHRTPSSGRHLLWKTEEFIEGGNKKLAFKEGEKEAGIETRAHGGYIMAPPGMGYEVEYDVPIPIISVEDHNRLITLAMLFNEKMPRKEIRSTKKYEEIYDENPFQHYNGSQAATELLLSHGWEIYKDVSDWIHFTRPGKDHGISASFNKSGRFYHFFTTSTEFDGDKTYDPAAVRCLIEFENEYKKMYPVLVKEGFGRHKAYYEDKMVKKATETGKPLPPNFSKEAKEKLQVAVTEKNTKYPHGIYWEYNPNSESYIIQRELLDRFLNALGLRVHHGKPCVIEGQFVRKLKENKKKPGESEVYELIKSWIREEEEDTYLRIAHEFSKFWQASGEFIISKLQPLDEKRILKSNPKTCYKFFRDKIVEITAEEKRLVDYNERSEYLIWADERIDRDWKYVDRVAQEKSIYGHFIKNAINGDPLYVRRVIGYLCNDYKVSSERYIIALMEPTDPSKGGGTGKGFFVKILDYWTPVLVTNGQAVKKDIDQLLQNWNGQKVVHLSDLPKSVNLSDLKHLVSDDSQRKVLYENIQNVAAEDMPKFVLSGQFGLNTKDDGGVKDRIRMLSFSGYFSGNGSIRKEYGGDLPEIFTDADWDGYYSFLADCVHEYLKTREIEPIEFEELWFKGFDAQYSGGESFLRDALAEKLDEWSKHPYVSANEVWAWYKNLCENDFIPIQWRLKGRRKLHAAIFEFAENSSRYKYDYGKERLFLNGSKHYVVRVSSLE